MGKNKSKYLTLLVAAWLAIVGYPLTAFAQSSSTNYQVQESYFGSGGQVDSTSANFRARQLLGTLGSGSAASDNFSAVIGANTPSEPFLEMYVTEAEVDFGVLEIDQPGFGTAQAGDCNCSFSVRSYLSSEYVVVTASQPPQNESGHNLNAKGAQGAASTVPSVEEFGMNLADNSSPDTGTVPANIPDNSFADGKAETGYNLSDQYKYGVGDVIARSAATAGNPAIGKTNYTITYMSKISSITPAGVYRMYHDVVAVATF